MALEADQLKLGLAKGHLDQTKAALDKSAEDYKKEADEADAAKVLAVDESWKTDVQNLKSSIAAVETLKVAVEKLSDDSTTRRHVVHTTTPPAGTTRKATTTTTATATTYTGTSTTTW